MVIVGIHSGHDASISVIKDGKLIFASSVERFTKIKKDHLLPREIFDQVLSKLNLTLDDIDHITMGYYNQYLCNWLTAYSPENEPYPLNTFGVYDQASRILNHIEGTPRVELVKGKGYTLPSTIERINFPFASWHQTFKFHIPLNIEIEGYDRLISGYFINHHHCHAASTFYTSPFDKAAVFTVDASMNDHSNCSTMFLGEGTWLDVFKYPGYMMGNFYDAATEFLGLGPGTIKAGTLMGLSSYGKVSKKAQDNWKKWTCPIWERSSPEEDHIYINWLFSQITGRYPYIRYQRSEIVNNEPGHEHFTKEWQEVFTKKESDTQEVMDYAADIQYITERSLVEYSQQLFEESKNFNGGNLCTAGGTFLNCNANYKILNETGFNNMHLFPACGDDGISAGSALYLLHHIFQYPRQNYSNKELSYLGFKYNHQPQSQYSPQNLDLNLLAGAVAKGKIVCWYQGKGEFGPRALGNRSFICDPRNKDMKDILNSRVKFREWYRPFAPIVLNEYKEEWFDMDFESPFMLHTVPCKNPQEIPSVAHIDNSSRVQTLREEDNPQLYKLISNFKDLTGIPVVMNTSLNVKGEPIVETPEDAMRLFEESDVDVLVINNKMYFK
jgi:carbamoyltransferase